MLEDYHYLQLGLKTFHSLVSFVGIVPKERLPQLLKEAQVNNEYLQHLLEQRTKSILMSLKKNSECEWAYCTGGTESLSLNL